MPRADAVPGGRATEVSGELMLAGLRGALSWLQANQEAVNDLNVFPVPDGDTGSNMYLTLRSAVEEAERSDEPASAAAVMSAAAHGSLMGARGNSGVIFSQILRGFSQGLENRPAMDGPGVARALGNGATIAYKAVMKPTEGTILTVARDAAEAARSAAATGGADLRDVLGGAVREGHAAVRRTIDQLPVLREAGVVDAGGFGLAIILEGFAHAVLGDDDPITFEPEGRSPGVPRLRAPHGGPGEVEVLGRRGAASVAAREGGFGYCTEFLIAGPGLDIDALREELGRLGESALIVGDEEMVRVHIHTEDPEGLIGVASERGSLSRLKVENMTAQHHDVLERATEAGAPSPQALAVVAVAPSAGFRTILTSLGADRVVEGGQTMNPSIEALLTAVRAANAENVIVLPNNGNVILTAEQVDALAEGINVSVVPTRNLPQGVAALLALDRPAGLEANRERMTEATGRVRAVEITRAVRDTRVNGLSIAEGDIIAIIDGEITTAGSDPLEVIRSVLGKLENPPELVTVYRGAGVEEAEAAALVGALRRSHPDVEFELHSGGQEHYPYVLSLE